MFLNVAAIEEGFYRLEHTLISCAVPRDGSVGGTPVKLSDDFKEKIANLLANLRVEFELWDDDDWHQSLGRLLVELESDHEQGQMMLTLFEEIVNSRKTFRKILQYIPFIGRQVVRTNIMYTEYRTRLAFLTTLREVVLEEVKRLGQEDERS